MSPLDPSMSRHSGEPNFEAMVTYANANLPKVTERESAAAFLLQSSFAHLRLVVKPDRLADATVCVIEALLTLGVTEDEFEHANDLVKAGYAAARLSG